MLKYSIRVTSMTLAYKNLTLNQYGELSEWSKELVSKTSVHVSVPRVQIPNSPPSKGLLMTNISSSYLFYELLHFGNKLKIRDDLLVP